MDVKLTRHLFKLVVALGIHITGTMQLSYINYFYFRYCGMCYALFLFTYSTSIDIEEDDSKSRRVSVDCEGGEEKKYTRLGTITFDND